MFRKFPTRNVISFEWNCKDDCGFDEMMKNRKQERKSQFPVKY